MSVPAGADPGIFVGGYNLPKNFDKQKKNNNNNKYIKRKREGASVYILLY